MSQTKQSHFDHAPKGTLIAVVDGEPTDLSAEVDGATSVVYPMATEEVSLTVLRHSASHVMAQAVLRLFPDAQYAIGPPVENGFYYDFVLPRTITIDDLPSIEDNMRKIAGEDQRFVREDVPRETALEVFKDQEFKTDILSRPDETGEVKVGQTARLYKNPPDFVDLCLGPHVPSTRYLKHFKLLSVSGAYWRGDESRPQMQRIYGTAWSSAEDLAKHLENLEEAQRRDHRKLGRDLDLFSSPEEVGSGIYVWHPKGAMVRKILEDYSRDVHLENGYDIVQSPHIGREILWQTSGHLEKFADSMYPPLEAEEGRYYLKPMNCPFHIMIYKTHKRSYRELPLRYSELGCVYRHERSGTLHGLLRVRGMMQDDAHIFCRPDQLLDEIRSVMDLTIEFYRVFGFAEPVVHLSTNPGQAIGTPEMWERANSTLKDALDASPFSYEVVEGEGAFYGPKIDFHFKDALGRLRQCTTIQLDFALPDRFGLEYVDSNNEAQTPVMVHRALYGSVERFFGILLEHTAGALPPWLAPVHVKLVGMRETDPTELAAQLKKSGLRVEVDETSETLNYKVRRAEMEKVPWMLTLGPREMESNSVSVRVRGSGGGHATLSQAEFESQALENIKLRRLDAQLS